MVLKINPNNSIARSRLAQLKLEAGSPSAQAPSAPEPVSVEGQPKAQAPGPMKGQESGPPPEYSEFQAAYNNFDAPLNGSGSAFKTRADPRQPFKELTSEPALIGRTSSPILNKVEEISQKSSRHPEILAMVIGTGLVGLIVIVILIAMAGINNYRQASAYNTKVVFEVTYQSQLVFLPATWTATPAPATPTITPTIPPTPTNTLAPPAPSAAAEMDAIQQQVSELRGLDSLEQVNKYVVNRSIVEDALLDQMATSGYLEKLHDDERVLIASGLIQPTYGLQTFTLNQMVDHLGGVYLPWSKQIFVLGLQYASAERFVFGHQYDHALVDQYFHIDEMSVYPYCTSNKQRCDAIRALVEGDASLLMRQWLDRYASSQDKQEVTDYQPPPFLIPDQYPPSYAAMDLQFPSTYGVEFVKYLYNRGKWSLVNKAYSELPDSTEQIIHPEKYIRREAPIVVADPSLSEVLPAEWREIQRDSFGEWRTYMILGSGADPVAQQEDRIAAKAAAGWGGDTYQAFYNESDNATILAAHWVWDTQTDAKEFQLALGDYLDKRFRGNKLDQENSDCWKADGQVACLFETKSESLWLIAPSEALVERLVSLYTNFTKP